MYYRFADDLELFKEIVSSASSKKEVLERYGLRIHASYYTYLNEACQELGLEPPKFVPTGANLPKGSIPIEKVLVENCNYNRTLLRKRLLAEGLLRNICYSCGLEPMWNNKPLTLQLEHKNGVHNDNRLENLELLCPNCHSQTDTFGGKALRKFNPVCKVCNHPTSSRRYDLCASCAHREQPPRPHKRKIDWPPLEELLSMLEQSNYVQVGKGLGVSDNAVRKHIQRRQAELSSSPGRT